MQGWTIVFDLDGTLVDTAPDLIGATNFILSGLSLEPLPQAALRPTISFGARNLIIRGLALRGQERTVPEIDALLDCFLAYYSDNIAAESRPFEDAVTTIQAFRDAGARTAVCTNKRERLSKKLLGELGLAPLFETIAGVDTFAVCKPDPGHLTETIRVAGGDASRAIMIGDSEVDIETAKRAGIPVVGVTFGYPATPVVELAPDAVIGHYRELPSAVSRIVASRG